MKLTISQINLLSSLFPDMKVSDFDKLVQKKGNLKSLSTNEVVFIMDSIIYYMNEHKDEDKELGVKLLTMFGKML